MPRYSEEELLEAIRDYAEQHGGPPTKRDWKNENGMPDPTTIQRRFGSWNKGLKEAGVEINQSFSPEYIDITCKRCGKETQRLKSEIKGETQNFCSVSCSTTWHNKNNKRRELQSRECKNCGEELNRQSWQDRRLVCDSCNPQKTNWEELTLKEIRNRYKYQKHSRIRQLSRQKYLESELPKFCIICDYKKHVEICHLKSISDFSKNTQLSEINNIDNLVALCPNHHWELDYGNLNKQDILENMKRA